MENAASMMAVEFEPGIPSDSKGTIAPPVTALFADSGATMPSGFPSPKPSCRDQRFTSL
jgi:hypothetical protein